MNCSQCGAELPVGAGRCAQCGVVVRPPGIFQRLLRSLGFGRQVRMTEYIPGVQAERRVISTTRIQVHDEKTGETKTYDSVDKLPPEIRQRIEEAKASGAGTTVTQQKFTVQDSDGVTRTYNSLEEMPPHLREMVARMRGNSKL